MTEPAMKADPGAGEALGPAGRVVPGAAADRAEGITAPTPPMRAITQEGYGSVEVLRAATIDAPTAADLGPQEVLVRVRAAGLDRGTWHMMTGHPAMIRLFGRAMGFGLRGPTRPVPGLDLAGTVEAIGAEVHRFAVGDEVFGIGKGTFAEFSVAPEDKLSPKPAALTFEQAAVVPISGLTALQGLRDAGRLRAGQSVLILGASGGVGSYAVQIAKAMGAEVTGVCSTAKVDLVRALGADHVVDHQRGAFDESGRRYDLILDIGGHTPLRRLRRSLTRRGTLVVVGSETGGKLLGGFDRSLRAVAWSPFVSQRLTMLVSKETHVDLEPLAAMIDAGQLTPSVDRIYPLAEVPEAMRRLEAGEVRGKVAIAI
jgi:NADPH:quinone reductase-like Zn-dependent oxidoreductase